MDLNQLVFVLIVIPLLLLISANVVYNVADSSLWAFETTITNETVNDSVINGVAVSTFTLDYDTKENSTNDLITCYNGTGANWNVCINCTAIHRPRNTAQIRVGQNVNNNTFINCTYTGYTGDGYDAFEDSESGTWNGFSLGSQLPFVYIAMAVVGIVLGVFGFRHLFG